MALERGTSERPLSAVLDPELGLVPRDGRIRVNGSHSSLWVRATLFTYLPTVLVSLIAIGALLVRANLRGRLLFTSIVAAITLVGLFCFFVWLGVRRMPATGQSICRIGLPPTAVAGGRIPSGGLKTTQARLANWLAADPAKGGLFFVQASEPPVGLREHGVEVVIECNRRKRIGRVWLVTEGSEVPVRAAGSLQSVLGEL